MSQSFWKQNAAILEHFEVVPFFQKWGGRGGFIKQDIVWQPFCEKQAKMAISGTSETCNMSKNKEKNRILPKT